MRKQGLKELFGKFLRQWYDKLGIEKNAVFQQGTQIGVTLLIDNTEF